MSVETAGVSTPLLLPECKFLSLDFFRGSVTGIRDIPVGLSSPVVLADVVFISLRSAWFDIAPTNPLLSEESESVSLLGC